MPLDLPVPGLRRGRPLDHVAGPSESVVGERLGQPIEAGLVPPEGVVVRDRQRGRTMRVFEVSLACCALEYLAAATEPGRFDGGEAARTGFEVLGAEPFPASPSTADVLVVSGTVTDALAPAVRAAYAAMGEPRFVVAFGACSATGGPYWDSYSVVAGVDELVPVDVYVPGCPPRPEALLDALAEVRERLAQRTGG